MRFEGITPLQLLNQHIRSEYPNTGVLVIINNPRERENHPAIPPIREELQRWDYDICKALFRHEYIILELGINCPTLVDRLFSIANANHLPMRWYLNGELKSHTCYGAII